MDMGTWLATVDGVTKSRTRLSDLAELNIMFDHILHPTELTNK